MQKAAACWRGKEIFVVKQVDVPEVFAKPLQGRKPLFVDLGSEFRPSHIDGVRRNDEIDMVAGPCGFPHELLGIDGSARPSHPYDQLACPHVE